MKYVRNIRSNPYLYSECLAGKVADLKASSFGLGPVNTSYMDSFLADPLALMNFLSE